MFIKKMRKLFLFLIFSFIKFNCFSEIIIIPNLGISFGFQGDVPKVSFLSFSGLTRKSKCIYCKYLEIIISSTTMTFRTY